VGEQHRAPGDRGRRRLVPGRDQGHELVARLGVGQPLPVRVAGPHEQRQHVGAVVQARVGARGLDVMQQQAVEPGLEPVVGVRGGIPAPVELGQVGRDRGERIGHGVEDRAQLAPHAPVLDAEHRLQDHVERKGLRDGLDLDDITRPPPAKLVGDQPLHQPRVALHARAVEGRQQELAPGQVVGRLEREHRVLAEERDQEVVGVPLDRGVAREQALDRLAISRDHRGLQASDPGRKRVPVTAVLRAGELGVAVRPQPRLCQAGKRWAWREGHPKTVVEERVARRGRR